MIPQGFIQDLLARADIIDVVGRAVPLKKAGINYKGLCPFHGEKSPSFVVSPSRQTYHCFGCGVHGNAVGFLMEHGALNFVEAVKELAQELGVQVPEESSSPQDRARAAQQREQRLSLTELMSQATQHYRNQLKNSPRAIDYLKRRGLTGQIAARFGLGYAPAGRHSLSSCYPRYDDPQLVEAGLVIHKNDPGEEERRYDRFRDRIMFPIRNPKGEVIGFGGRILDTGEPKYLNSPETPLFVKGRELYGLFEGRAAIRERGFALVTEGYMDVVALAQLGVPNAVATLGTACTADHVGKLLRFTEDIVFSFDGDAAGRRAAARALEAVLPHASDTRRFRFLFLPADHDPDSYIREFGADAFAARIGEALPLSAQLISLAREGCDLDTPEGRARMLAQARPLVEQLPQGLLREQLRVELARDGQIPAETLAQYWAEPASRPRRPSAPTTAPAHRAPERPDTNPDLGPEPPHWHEADLHSEADPTPPPPSGRAWSPDRPPRRDGGTWSPTGGARGERRWSKFRDRDREARPATPLQRAASHLDRIVWLLVHRCDAWNALSADAHTLLADQPPPYGQAFAAIERELQEHGPIAAPALLDALRQDPAREITPLAERVSRMLDPLPDLDLEVDLCHLVDKLLLQSLEEEWKRWQDARPSSPEDMEYGRELNTRLTELRLKVQRGPAKSTDP